LNTSHTPTDPAKRSRRADTPHHARSPMEHERDVDTSATPIDCHQTDLVSETQLLPCPFCNDRMELWDHDTHARHVSSEGICPLRNHAVQVDSWNTRADLPRPEDAKRIAELEAQVDEWRDEYKTASKAADVYRESSRKLVEERDAVLADRALILAERDRTFAMMLERAETAEAEVARLRESLTGAGVHIENLLSVMATPDTQMCCDGRMCGCQGATVYQEAEYFAREELRTIRAMTAPSAKPEE
jgi:hypothetical protein